MLTRACLRAIDDDCDWVVPNTTPPRVESEACLKEHLVTKVADLLKKKIDESKASVVEGEHRVLKEMFNRWPEMALYEMILIFIRCAMLEIDWSI
ncbi:hypothetical protein RIF29_28461 [Crotalaria pallida]|uniref:Uncharacterized protein n=1 Tax=Crotalaria pallida TaxID=3830 RepID=A0AAN9ECU7_CROPI